MLDSLFQCSHCLATRSLKCLMVVSIMMVTSTLHAQPTLRYIPNKGQVRDTEGNPRPDILYTASAPGMNIYVRRTGISFVLYEARRDSVGREDRIHKGKLAVDTLADTKIVGHRVDMEFVEGEVGGVVEEEEKTTDYINIYRGGSDPIEYLYGYGRLVMRDVWRGIDVVLKSDSGRMKYEFVVQPGRDPSVIRLQYDGTDAPLVDAEGSLAIETTVGRLRDMRPVSFQSTMGRSSIDSVSTEYRVSHNVVEFAVDEYDTRECLIVDPTLLWSTYYGGSGPDIGGSYPGYILLKWEYYNVGGGVDIDDNTGTTYVCGVTRSGDFPVTPGAFQTSPMGNDACIVSLESRGSTRWATYLGGSYIQIATDIRVGPNAMVMVTGVTLSSNFPTTPGAYSRVLRGTNDAFLCRFDTNGILHWSTYFGGSQSSQPVSYVAQWASSSMIPNVDIDPRGNVILAGRAFDTDFPVTNNAFQTVRNGSDDAFIARFDSSGALRWCTLVGGSDIEQNVRSDVDSSGRIILAMSTGSTDFPVTTGTYRSSWTQSVVEDSVDIALILFDSSGNRLWGTYYGGSEVDILGDVMFDGTGSICLAGTSYSMDLPTTSASLQPAMMVADTNLVGDGFIARFSSIGGHVWSTYYGSTGPDFIFSVARVGVGGIGVGGYTGYSVVKTRKGPFPLNRGAWDGFVAVLDTGGNLNWDTYLGGRYSDILMGIAGDPIGTVVAVGATGSDDFPTANAVQSSYHGTPRSSAIFTDPDLFITRICYHIEMDDIFASGPLTFCDGDSVVLTGPAGFARYRWSTGVDSAQRLVVRRSGTYHLFALDSFGCGAYSDTLNVVVHQRPHDSIRVFGPTDFCEGDSVLLVIAHPGARSYRWSTGSTNDSIVVRTSGSYSVEITDTNGCREVTPPQQIIVRSAPPFARITPRDTVRLCPDSMVTLSIGGNYSLIEWSNGVKGPTNRVGAGRYWARVYNPEGCTNASDTVTVEMYPRRTVSITPLGSVWICPGDSVRLEASPGFASYQWSTGESGRRIWARRGGGYIVTARDSNGCVVVSPPQAINELGAPPLKITVTPKPIICEGDSAVLDAGEGLYKSYKWSTGDTTARIVVRSAGWYTVAVITHNDCKGGSSSQVIGVFPRPEATIAGPEEVCAGTRATYTAPDKPGLVYEWTMTGSGSTVGSTNDRSVTVAWGTGGSGTVTVTVRDPFTGCDSSFTLPVTIGTSLLPRISSSRLTVCPGDSVELDAGAGYTEYTWTTGETTRTIWAKAGMVYRVTVKNAEGCSGTSNPVTIRESQPPVPRITLLGSSDLCAGSTVTLDAGAGYAQYQWSDGTTGRYLTTSESGEYTVSVVDTNNCTGVSSPVTITVHPLPHPDIAGPSEVCRNSTSTYSATLHTGSTYAWTVTGGTIQSGQGTEQITVLWGASGGGRVEVEETTSARCVGRSDIFDVIVGTRLRPVITPSGTIGFCPGDSVTLDAGGGYASYLWSTGENTRRITIRTAGMYNVAVSDAGGCSGRSNDVEVHAWQNPAPIVQPLGPTTFIDGDSVVLEVANTYASYRWNTGRTTRRITVKASGTYSVEVTDSNGCRGLSAPIVVTVTPKDPGTGKDTADVHILIGRVGAGTGDEFTIPIRMTETKLASSGATRLRGELRFNRTLMYPRGATAAGFVDGNDRVVPIKIDLTTITPGAEIATIEFVATLGNAERTPVRLEKVEFLGGIVRSTVEQGEFELTDLCREGGTRLVNAEGDFGIKSVRPNPATEMMLIEYEVIEDTRTEMALIDVTGREVRTIVDAALTKGRYRVGLDLRGLPAGAYTVVLGTERQRSSMQIGVVR